MKSERRERPLRDGRREPAVEFGAVYRCLANFRRGCLADAATAYELLRHNCEIATFADSMNDVSAVRKIVRDINELCSASTGFT
jgi:hypothetical protein